MCLTPGIISNTTAGRLLFKLSSIKTLDDDWVKQTKNLENLHMYKGVLKSKFPFQKLENV